MMVVFEKNWVAAAAAEAQRDDKGSDDKIPL
jgi:hypothetical protein